MFRRHKDHSIPELNTTSTADISFMLLIFFLVTTSMETEKGLSRKLPAQTDDNDQEYTDVIKDKVITLSITTDGHILCDEEQLPDAKLEERLTEFISKIGPEHIIQIKAGPDAKYDTYFHLQNILSRVYGNLREQYAQAHYHKSFADCSDNERKTIRDKYPQHLSEDLSGGTADTDNADDGGATADNGTASEDKTSFGDAIGTATTKSNK